MDVMHLSPGQPFVKMAFGGAKSISSEELSRHTAFADQSALSTSPASSDKSSVLSLDTEQELKAVEQLEASRRQLESEIDVSQTVLTCYCRGVNGRVSHTDHEPVALCRSARNLIYADPINHFAGLQLSPFLPLPVLCSTWSVSSLSWEKKT